MKISKIMIAAMISGGLVPALHAQADLVFRSSITNSLGESVVYDSFSGTVFGNSTTGVEYATLDSNLQFGTLGNINLGTYFASADPSFVLSGISSVDVDPLGRGFGVAAVTAGTNAVSNLGAVVFFNTSTKAVIGHQIVGYHPDMVTFNSTGTNILVANESDNAITDGDTKPGSISNINVSSVNNTLNFGGISVTTVDFSGVNPTLLTGVRDHGAAMNRNNGLPSDTTPNINRIEPEYITVSGNNAYVTLQEANAVGVFDISTNQWTAIQKLGVNVQTMDARNNGSIGVTDSIATLAMPDAISSFTVGGNTYYITANEGDLRDDDGDRTDGDEFTVQNGVVGAIDPNLDATLDGLYDGNWQSNSALANTKFLGNVGDLDGDGDIDQLTLPGSRSMSVFNAADGSMLFDTNDLADFNGFETWIETNDAAAFNINQGGTTIDNRSDDKGPEPEAVAVGEFEGDLYALVGMERTNHLFLFKLVDDLGTATSFDPNNVQFIEALRWSGQVAPETIDFVSGANSPTGVPFFLVGSESSNTWAVYTIPEPTSAGLAAAALTGLLALRRRRR